MSRCHVLVLASMLFASTSAGLVQQPPIKKGPDGFPIPYNSGTEKNLSPPKSAAEVAATIKLPPGFKATAYAGEPDVRNPIAMAWDGKGRLWVAENYTFAESAIRWDLNLSDRIVIFDDPHGTGHFTERKVFYDKLKKLTSVEVGHGGVWALCPPQLLFIPDRDGDGVPDGRPEVVLDGFTVSATHHTLANGLRFGLDGWLYGRCGHSNPGELGRPGTPAAERIPLRGSIWRYHPIKKVVEVVSHGSTNSWGHDWDENGEMFFVNTVTGHFFHSIPGAHFTRNSKDPNPRAYELIPIHADHTIFMKGGNKGGSGNGHACVGMTVYLGDNWPDEYRGRVLTLNLFGHRVNQEVLERAGSGYVAHAGPDMVLIPDPWFRGLDIRYGPDGGVYILDWSDTGDYHDRSGVHRDSGRIYKITYGDAKPSTVGDLHTLSIEQLVALHSHRNEWFPRQARDELITRMLDGRGVGKAKELLRALFDKEKDGPMKLRALWTLYGLGAADDQFLLALLRDPNEHLRVWGVRMLTDFWPLDNVMSKRPAASVAGPEITPAPVVMDELVRLAKDDPSGLVRLSLASTLQRLPVAQRPKLAAALVSHTEDAKDHNLPLLIWYGLIPLANSDSGALASIAGTCEIPQTRTYITRRLAEELDKNIIPVNGLLHTALQKSDAFQSDILDGLAQGLKGVRKSAKPPVWDSFASKVSQSSNVALRNKVRDLSVILGDARALVEARKAVVDKGLDMEARKSALQAIIDTRPDDLRELCESLLAVVSLNAVAARGLATFDDPAIGAALVKSYPGFAPADRPHLIAVLTVRPVFAQALLSAVEEKKIPRADVTAFDAAQIRSLNNAALKQEAQRRLGRVAGHLGGEAAANPEIERAAERGSASQGRQEPGPAPLHQGLRHLSQTPWGRG